MSNPPSSSAPVTNELPLVLAPKITAIPSATRSAAGVATIAVNFSPHVWPGQSPQLLVGSLALPYPHLPQPPLLPTPPSPPTTPVNSLTFVGVVPAGTYYLRLRFDGIDSPIVVNTPTPSLDTSVRVTLP